MAAVGQATSTVAGYDNYFAGVGSNRFYTVFNPTTDIIENPSRLYIDKIVDSGSEITWSEVSEGVVAGSYNGQTLLTATSGLVDSYNVVGIRSLLRSYTSSMSSDWAPVNGGATADYVTLISFTNNSYGDKLSINSSDENRFAIKLGDTTYYGYSQSNASFGYDIKSEYKQSGTNFGLLTTGSSAPSAPSQVKGLVFGQLGLVMLYGGDNIPLTNGITLSNVAKEQRLNSKTFFCRITHEKYNASLNPTWVQWSPEMNAYVVRSGDDGSTFTAITSIGLYNDDNELLAVAKLSEPVLKLIDSELHAKVVLQY